MPALRRRLVLPPRVLRQTLVTAALTWACLRGALLLFYDVRAPDWRSALLMAVFPALIVRLDVRLLRERTLLGNLGYSTGAPFRAGLIVGTLLELIAQVLPRLTGAGP